VVDDKCTNVNITTATSQHTKSKLILTHKTGMHNLRPTGQIRPPKELYPALGAG